MSQCCSRTLAWSLLLLGLCVPGFAQVVPSDSLRNPEARPFRTHLLGVWIGGGTWNTTGVIGKMEEATLGMLAVQYQHPLGPDGQQTPFRVQYTATLFPWVHVSVPASAIPLAEPLDPPRPDPRTRFSARGIGGSPIGLQVNYRADPVVQPFLRTSVGIVYLSDALPDHRGKRLNFTIDLGIGVQSAVSDHTMLSIGYRYHHLSNGFRGRINPGVDTHLFHLGLSYGL